MGLGYQAVNLKAPEFRVKQANGTPSLYSSVILYDMQLASQVHEVPEEFWGKYVSLFASGGDLQYLFSDDPACIVSTALAASAAGNRSAQLGGIVASGTERQRRIPTPPQGGKMYFARAGSAAGSVRIELASD